jgi:phage terminase small subunit
MAPHPKPTNQKPRRRLTPKQKEFARQYIEQGCNGTQAVINSYAPTDYGTARMIASNNLTKSNVRDEIARLCRQSGLTPEHQINRLTQFVNDDEQARWALPLSFDVTGLRAPQKTETTHKLDLSDGERQELEQLRASVQGPDEKDIGA